MRDGFQAQRLVYFVAGLSASYMCLAPIVSGWPDLRPLWVTFAFWCGAISLICATALATRGAGDSFAAIGSGIIVALYACLVSLPVLVRLGYYHPQYRLVAAPSGALGRWRFVLDKPVLCLLLFSALASFVLSISSLLKRGKEEPPAQDASPGLAH